MVVGVLGILKAGGAYVPLDPSHPAQRLANVMEDARPAVLVTQRALLDALPNRAVQTVLLDADHETIARQECENPSRSVEPGNLAYVIFTSGSTGRPKGVQIPHQALGNFLHSMRLRPGIAESDVLLAVTTLSFDIANLELLLPLTVGARVVIAGKEVTSDARRLAELLGRSTATIVQATPATWRMLLETGAVLNGLKILCGGEALPRDLADRLLDQGAAVWNMYGPTETTVWSTTGLVPRTGPVDLGRPIANTQILLLDRSLELVPIGVPGELYIGGEGLARGYLNRPELTVQRFIPNPFDEIPTKRLYRTGDTAVYQPDGKLVYLGRGDDQVKVRGVRIELGYVDTALCRHPDIRAAAVIARPDHSGENQLSAYIVPRVRPLDIQTLRVFLRQTLPNSMIPANFVELESLPLNSNGKVDRKSLPALEPPTAPAATGRADGGDPPFICPAAAVVSPTVRSRQLGLSHPVGVAVARIAERPGAGEGALGNRPPA
jgi:amino acid adenylation domain-containing protein